MKVFDETQGWTEKVNFVDENNVFVGYDLTEDCCEHADWYITDRVCWDYQEGLDENMDQLALEDYSFDQDFYEHDSPPCLEDGGMVIFRLVAPALPDLYLHLFNCQNGYYGHGFEFTINGVMKEAGTL